MPSAPYWQLDELKDKNEKADGAVFELKPIEMDDYPGWSDLLVASSGAKHLWLAQHSVRPFYSCRFSNHNEQFCYLKIDGTSNLKEEIFEDRMSIEDALDDCLIPNKIGCVIGGGTGLMYSYIDLAIADMKRAIPIICDVLKKGKISKRTWLLFYDPDLADEWVGVYEDTPSPPLSKKGNN